MAQVRWISRPTSFIYVFDPLERPDLQELVRTHCNLSWDKVKQVLLHLGVPKHRIDDVEAIHPTDEESRRTTAWDCWLQMDVSASWWKVAHALRACDVEVMVRPVARGMCAANRPVPVPTSFVGR